MKLKKDSASLVALRALLAGILCVMMILSAVSCGKDLSAFPEENSRTEDAGPEPSDGAGKEEKWAFYVYMVGSDLESAHLDQLSKFTKTLVEEEAKKQEQEYNDTVAERLRTFTEEVYAEGLELPGALFNKTEYQEKNDEEPDPDATGYATYSLDLMLGEEIPEGVEFVIQTGGTRRWQSPLVNPNRSQRFVIDCDGIGEVSNEPIVNMADPETLEDFIVFCKEYYPAQHEVLLFWDHGGGYSGFGMDEIFGKRCFSAPA